MEKPDYEFSESDFDLSKNQNPFMAGKILWAFEQDKKTRAVTIMPMNNDKVIIREKKEAEIFCSILIGHFQ